jgi:drug/metabolite transporter (DMT)-like permease
MYALFASIFTVAKATLAYASPCFLLGSRMTVAGILILAYQSFTSRKALAIEKADLPNLALTSFFVYFLTNVLEFWGLQDLTSSKACFIYNLSPFLSAIISYLILSEGMSGKKWLGLMIGFLGMGWLLYRNDSSDEIQLISFLSKGELFLIGAVISSAYGWIMMRKLRHRNYPALTINGIGMLLGGILSLITSFITEEWNPAPVTSWPPVIEGSIYMLIVSNLLAYNLYSHLLHRFTATFLSFAGFVTPLFAAAYGAFFLKEPLSSDFFIAAAVVFVGLYIFYQQELYKDGVTHIEQT